MNRLRLLSSSVACAVIFAALAHLFGGTGGLFLAAPGMIAASFLEVSIMVLSETERYYPLLDYVPHFNVVFYSISIYVVLWLYALVKTDNDLHHEYLRQHTLR